MSRDLILVPGLNNTAAVFDRLLPELRGDANCRALTNPALDTVEAIAEAQLPTLPPKFHVVGFSFGGYVALAMLAKAPERITGLTLLCTGCFADSPEQAANRQAAIEKASTGDYEAMIAGQAANAFHPDSLSNTALMDARRAMVHDYGVARFVAHQKAAGARPDRTDLLRAYRGPLLFAAASHDKVFPPAAFEKMKAALPNAKSAMIDDAGHLAPMEKPAAVAAVLRDWLKS